MTVSSTFCKLLVMLFHFSLVYSSKDGREFTCQELGGSCIPSDPNTCLHTIDVPGCQEDEVCCKTDIQAIIEDDPCPTTNECLAMQGRCDEICGEDEESKPTVKCYSSDCNCCVPKPKPCKDTHDCTAAGGRCSESCWPEENAKYGLCEGECPCCTPSGKDCIQTSPCQAANGICKPSCKGDSVTMIPDLCHGPTCKCCSRTVHPFEQCKMFGGFCSVKPCLHGTFYGICSDGTYCCISPWKKDVKPLKEE